jgi:hypothetical protein
MAEQGFASPRFRLISVVFTAWLFLNPAVHSAPIRNSEPSNAIIQRLLQMNQARLRALRAYRSQRRYAAENKHFALRADVAVDEAYSYPGVKTLQVQSEKGSKFISRKVIDKLIEAEVDAAKDANRDQTQMTPDNYVFRQTGADVIGGRECYVFEVAPKLAKKYLMRGSVWIDAEDFAIVRMEGSPAKNPSFWTRKTHFVRSYQKHGVFWLPASTESDSELLIAGKSTLRIDYSNYDIDSADDAAVTVEAAKGGS